MCFLKFPGNCIIFNTPRPLAENRPKFFGFFSRFSPKKMGSVERMFFLDRFSWYFGKKQVFPVVVPSSGGGLLSFRRWWLFCRLCGFLWPSLCVGGSLCRSACHGSLWGLWRVLRWSSFRGSSCVRWWPSCGGLISSGVVFLRSSLIASGVFFLPWEWPSLRPLCLSAAVLL